MTALDRALVIWEEGYPLPLDLAAELIEQGLDVETLEQKHRQF